MAPLILYAIFGTSRSLAVGPVAVASLMTAAAAGKLASQGSPEYLGAAIALAMVSGLLLLLMGFLKLGLLADFLEPPGNCRFYHRIRDTDSGRSAGTRTGDTR